jgi:3-deoxy-D-manno-octulosonic-acid transferase
LHAVSLGEVNASRTIVEALKYACPACRIVISSTTDTGYMRARALFAKEHHVTYMPLDISFCIRQAFDRIRPSLCLLMELEVWPHMAAEAYKRSIPIVVINGRISDRSYRRYLAARPFLRGTFSRLTLALVQTDQYAQRFISLGCSPEKVAVTGLLKFDTAQLDQQVEGARELACQLGLDGARVWVAGGTGDGEEAQVLEAYRYLKEDTRLAGLRLVIVPRKPERFDAVADLISAKGLPLARYSLIKQGKTCPAPGAVILGDTIGDLRRFYSLAAVIFVGRSLVPMGGSDMIEAAAFGRPTIFGPHIENFRQPAQLLLAADGAIQVKDARGLADAVARCLLDEHLAKSIGQRARQTIRDQQGATNRTIAHIIPLLTRKGH